MMKDWNTHRSIIDEMRMVLRAATSALNMAISMPGEEFPAIFDQISRISV